MINDTDSFDLLGHTYTGKLTQIGIKYIKEGSLIDRNLSLPVSQVCGFFILLVCHGVIEL